MKSRFYYWGPLLIAFKISDEQLNQVKKLCSKRNEYVNPTLVGVIKNEHKVDHKKYQEIIKPYLTGYEETYTKVRVDNMGVLRCTSAWVNYMKQHEYNPPHSHSNCEISSVLFVNIPEKLKKENEKWVKSNVNYGGPGSISFFYGTAHKYNIECHEFFPEEGQLLLFPKDLKHFVSPFFSKCERVSVAANFVVD